MLNLVMAGTCCCRTRVEPKDVQEVCQYISNLCKEEGCGEPSELCAKAASAVGSKDEEKYLDLCAQSCVKCGEAPKTTDQKRRLRSITL